MEGFNFLPGLSFHRGVTRHPRPPCGAWGTHTASVCQGEIGLQPYRGIKKKNGWASIIHHLCLHQCHRAGDWEYRKHGPGMLKLQKQKWVLAAICQAFLRGRQNCKALKSGCWERSYRTTRSVVSRLFALVCLLFGSWKYRRCCFKAEKSSSSKTRLRKCEQKENKRRCWRVFISSVLLWKAKRIYYRI